MYLAIFLAAIIAVGLCAGSFYAGYRLSGPGPVRKKLRKPRPPKCYVVVPGGPDEVQKKPTRKRKISSGDATTAEFDEKHIKGTDIRIK